MTPSLSRDSLETGMIFPEAKPDVSGEHGASRFTGPSRHGEDLEGT